MAHIDTPSLLGFFAKIKFTQINWTFYLPVVSVFRQSPTGNITEIFLVSGNSCSTFPIALKSGISSNIDANSTDGCGSKLLLDLAQMQVFGLSTLNRSCVISCRHGAARILLLGLCAGIEMLYLSSDG